MDDKMDDKRLPPAGQAGRASGQAELGSLVGGTAGHFASERSHSTEDDGKEEV